MGATSCSSSSLENVSLAPCCCVPCGAACCDETVGAGVAGAGACALTGVPDNANAISVAPATIREAADCVFQRLMTVLPVVETRSLDRVAAPFEAGGARLRIRRHLGALRCLGLLRGLLLLRRVLAAALRTTGGSACRRTRSCIADHSADDRAARGPACAGTRRRARRRRRRGRRGCGLLGLRRVDARVLRRPFIAFGLVLLLL